MCHSLYTRRHDRTHHTFPIPPPVLQVTPSSTTEMRTKLFPDEAAEALDELEYHPHHGHAPGTRASGGGVGTGAIPPPPPGPSPSPDGAIGVGERPSVLPGTGSGANAVVSVGGEGNDAVGLVEGGKDDSGQGKKKGTRRGGTMMQRMNKTFRPDPLAAYTGDRSTLRFKPRRQEGLTTLRPRQQRTIFDASQISPMLQVGGGKGDFIGVLSVPDCCRAV